MTEESKHKQEKLAIMYRYSMPLQWILDMLSEGKPETIEKFDILNAQHSLDMLICRFKKVQENHN